jgi:hypothetical protein
MAISRRARSAEPTRGTLALDEVPIVRVLNAGIALVDQPPRPMPAGFDADALRLAASIGPELKDLALPKDKSGRTVVNAASVLRVLRSDRARPIPRADIDFASGLVRLEGVRWLALAADEREAVSRKGSNLSLRTIFGFRFATGAAWPCEGEWRTAGVRRSATTLAKR